VLQARKTTPKLDQLRSLLSSQTLDLIGLTDEDEEKFIYTTKALEMEIQASEKEILDALERIGAFQYHGKWCTLTPQSEHTLLEEIATAIRAQGWNFSSVSFSQCKKLLGTLDYHSDVISHCTNYMFSSPDKNGKSKFDSKKFAISCAVYLFSDKPVWQTAELMEQWQTLVRDDVQISLDLLKGLVIVDGGKITWFPSYSLSTQPQLRFQVLFKQQTRLTYSQILPYLEDIVAPSLSVEQLLLQWTVCTTSATGEKMYTLKEI